MRDVLSDEEVVRRVVAGERELFELVVRRHNQRLFRTIRSIVGDDERAEEALQRTYIRAWRRLATFDARSSLIAWLSRVAIREARDMLRGERRRDAHSTRVVALSSLSPAAPSPLQSAAEQELIGRVDAAVSSLPEEYRSVFVLRVAEQLPTAEVASLLELTISSVKVRLHRARDLLRRRLGEQAVSEARFDALWEFAGDRCDRTVALVMAMARIGS